MYGIPHAFGSCGIAHTAVRFQKRLTAFFRITPYMRHEIRQGIVNLAKPASGLLAAHVLIRLRGQQAFCGGVIQPVRLARRVGKGQQSAFFRKTDMFNAACAGNLEAETAQNKGAACLHTVAAHDAATGDRGRRIEIGSARLRSVQGSFGQP